MASILRSLRAFGRRAPFPPRAFTNPNCGRITGGKIREEASPDYPAIRKHPVRIGKVFALRYHIVGKLGYGTFPTVWLARNLQYVLLITAKYFVVGLEQLSGTCIVNNAISP